MKKNIIALTLAFAFTFTAVSGITAHAEEPQQNPLVQQLNAMTGNYIGYDMTEADKVKVLNAIVDSARNATSFTVTYGLIARDDNWYADGSYVEGLTHSNPGRSHIGYWNNGNSCDYMYNGDYNLGNINDVRYVIDGEAYNSAIWQDAFMDPMASLSKAEYIRKCDHTKGPNTTWSIENAIDRGAFTVEYLAANSTYTEDANGIPYLVVRCPLTDHIIYEFIGYGPDPGESTIADESMLKITFPLNNYGAFTADFKCMLNAAPNDPICPNGKYLWTTNFGYSNVNCTELPPMPADYCKMNFRQ